MGDGPLLYGPSATRPALHAAARLGTSDLLRGQYFAGLLGPRAGRVLGPADLLAVACLGSWHEMPTIGVLTHPGARGRGLVIDWLRA